MATPSITPRLRMTRHSPTHDKHNTSTSEAGPSRLPDLSQLVNFSLKDMDISDDNMYASDVPTEPNRQAQSSIATKAESPAAVLRALLSRLPNNDERAVHHPDHCAEHQYPSERESDYDVETASATTSVAQSSLKNIFSRALREPGDTPRKDKSHRGRSSSIGATDIESTPHVIEAQDIKGKRRSLSDDELDNKASARPRTRLRITPQPLTQQFLREHFGKFSDSPVKHRDATGDENSLNEVFPPRLDSSQTSPPMATSTPQRSLISFNQSRFNSNLLDKDSEMQNAFNALDSSTDNLSNRSISPIPTLQAESDQSEAVTHTKLHESTIHGRGLNFQTSLQATPRFSNMGLPLSVPSTAKAARSRLTGEQSMSLSLPVGHTNLQPNADNFQLTNGTHGGLSHHHSITSLRPSSPMPEHRRPHTPVDPVHERERNWNKTQAVQRENSLSRRSSMSSIRSSSPMPNRGQDSNSPVDAQEGERRWSSVQTSSQYPHHSRNHSLSSPRPKSPMHRPESPADIHERERNWNAPHPKWHDGLSHHASKESSAASIENDRRLVTNGFGTSRDFSHGSGYLHAHRTPPKPIRNPPSRPLTPLPPEKASPSLRRTSSIPANGSWSRPQTPSSLIGRPESPSVAVKSSGRRPATPAGKLSKPSTNVVTSTPIERTNGLPEPDVEETTRGKAVSVLTPYSWPVIDSDHQQTQSTTSNGHTLAHDSGADDVRETDYSSSIDTPKPKLIEPPDISDGEYPSGYRITSNAPDGNSTVPLTPPTQKNVSLDADQVGCSDLPSTPPHRMTPNDVKLEFKTPSPPRTLPELPTPSSSDESNDGSFMKMAKIPKLGTSNHNKWLQTPKPPGGWLTTPQPANFAEETILDEPETPLPNVGKDSAPGTPVVVSHAGRLATKTPKPPGGWATPASASVKSESDYPDDNGQGSQLLTPINSLSRGTALNSKTPGVPGGWLNTPAARKSVLKVRFDPQSPEVKEESRGEDSNPSEVENPTQAGDTQDVTLPSPRSPRRPKATIRVLDAFGREETPSSSPKKEARSGGIRVLDTMGRDIQAEQSEVQDDMEESTLPLSREVLLSRLRRGLNELAENIDVMDKKEDIFASDRSHIEELVATSRQARGARQKLSSHSKKIIVPPPVVKPSSYVSFGWKMWFGFILVQGLLFWLMYRICVVQAQNFFFTAYYDPFNPELHLRLFKSDNNIFLLDPPFVWPRIRAGASWFTWFGSIDIAAYLSTLLSVDALQSGVWTPT